ncbi:AzlD domain-containing protein [Citreicella sp. C3M06]|uniref:AzlD domain-containing protein n=1 Tax=Roseobacteraceae TaxID=2854170 RepID=UPI001C08425B|nr:MULTISPECIES: AzlD domain-containing protein [Roseobacteraceae]MBU2959467.1 AzlD domain-containing protein [Citreicella sp. C3M06]MDO6586267.1 AzlD domain-containing protein [Salipiger sp. 1_MG-2023]
MIDHAQIWIIIAGLGIGSFALRFVFLGLIGDRALPPAVMRHLRYTAVSVLPALVMPLVVWPVATDGETDPLRLAAAAVTLAIATLLRNVLAAMLAGAAVLILGAWL